MSPAVERRFRTAGRVVPWFAVGLGLFLVADAVWCIWQGNLWAALVVGGVGLERLVFAATDYWHRRLWRYRLAAVRFDPDGVTFEERDAYGGQTRTTRLPAGLVLDARVQRGTDRGAEAPWLVLLFTILGTLIWSEHDEEEPADAELLELQRVLEARGTAELTAPAPTGTIELIPEKRGVMWGVRPWLPWSILVRSVLLLATIVAVPNLVGGAASWMLWILTVVTVALLAFPAAGAIAVLRRRGELLGFGATAQFGELRAWEHSNVSQVAPLRSVRHIGFGDLALTGEPLALRLSAHTEPGTAIDAIVPRSAVAHLAQQAFRVVAQLHDHRGDAPPDWSVRLPGGIAEAIEATSWAQKFRAEALDDAARAADDAYSSSGPV